MFCSIRRGRRPDPICSGGGWHSVSRHLTKQEHHMSGVVGARRQHVVRWQEPREGRLTYLLVSCRVVVLVTLEVHTVTNYSICAHKDELWVTAPPCNGCTYSCNHRCAALTVSLDLIRRKHTENKEFRQWLKHLLKEFTIRGLSIYCYLLGSPQQQHLKECF